MLYTKATISYNRPQIRYLTRQHNEVASFGSALQQHLFGAALLRFGTELRTLVSFVHYLTPTFPLWLNIQHQ